MHIMHLQYLSQKKKSLTGIHLHLLLLGTDSIYRTATGHFLYCKHEKYASAHLYPSTVNKCPHTHIFQALLITKPCKAPFSLDRNSREQQWIPSSSGIHVLQTHISEHACTALRTLYCFLFLFCFVCLCLEMAWNSKSVGLFIYFSFKLYTQALNPHIASMSAWNEDADSFFMLSKWKWKPLTMNPFPRCD